MKQIRKGDRMSYAEAVKRMEGNENMTGQTKPDQTREERVINNDQNICLDKKRFLAFIAMVINSLSASSVSKMGGIMCQPFMGILAYLLGKKKKCYVMILWKHYT